MIRHPFRPTVLTMAGLLVLLVLPTNYLIAQEQIKAGKFTVTFDAEAKPVSLADRKGNDLLTDDSLGFFLGPTRFDARLRFNRVTKIDGNEYRFSTSDGSQSFTAKFGGQNQYLTIRFTSLSNVDYQPGEFLYFAIKSKHLKVFALDYMTVECSHGDYIAACREALWEHSAANPMGGLALYASKNEKHADSILLDIWVNEGLPHPKVEGPWTLEKARDWMDRWIKLNQDTSHLNLIAKSMKEMGKALPYARRMDAKAIYLWPGMWRGEYWLERRGNAEVNPKVFPRGEESLLVVAKALQKRDLKLKLHYLSGSIGEHDPDFVSPEVSAELASWGTGRLAEAISPDKRDMVIELDNGVGMPVISDQVHLRLPPPNLPRFFDFRTFRIGEEWVQAKEVESIGANRWRLTNCRRGAWESKATSHPSGASWRGYLRTYNQDFVPDNNSPLLETIAKRWAELNNRLGTTLANFDGLENHAYNGSWGCRKFATLVYQNLDHPVQGTSSSGAPPSCFLEYRFSEVKRLCKFLGDDSGTTLYAADPSRPAPGLEEAQYMLSHSAFRVVRGFDLKSYDVKGIPFQTLRDYGLIGDLLLLIKAWKQASFNMGEKDREKLSTFEKPTPEKARLSGHHKHSRTLWRLEKGQITPWYSAGNDLFTDAWHTGQEHGVITPRIYLKEKQISEINFGERLPSSSQIQIIGRVLPRLRANDSKNIELMTHLLPLANKDSSISTAGNGALIVQGKNSEENALYRTEFQQHEIRNGLDLSRHRGIGMWVTGDGSGALLVIQLRHGNARDFVVPIDFTDRRWIEIPCGEVAWRLREWGWRSDTGKMFKYDNVRTISIGLGMIPAKKDCRIQVEGVVAMKESANSLKNPVFQLDRRRIQVNGTIPSKHHFIITPNSEVHVYDADWNLRRTLPAIMTGQFATNKTLKFACLEGNSGWLEVGIQANNIPKAIQVSK